MTTLFFFVLGTAVGSFLNVVAFRTVHGGSISVDRSKCPHCHKKLESRDLVPIVSFLLLRGSCRYCHKPISWRYPASELATGALFVLAYLTAIGAPLPFLQLLALLLLVGVFVVLFITDLYDGVLPNSVVLFGIVSVLVFKILFVFLGVLTLSELMISLMVAFFVALLFFGIVVVTSEKAMGGGDVKLIFLIGISLSWLGFLLALFVGFLTGALVAVMLILLGKKRVNQTVPLGPFLVVGAFVALFWGKEIIDLYLKMSV